MDKQTAIKHVPASPLPELHVEWFYESAVLKDGNGKRVAVFRDSVRAGQFEELARRANAYPQLVKALHNAATGNLIPLVADQILRSLGESV